MTRTVPPESRGLVSCVLLTDGDDTLISCHKLLYQPMGELCLACGTDSSMLSFYMSTPLTVRMKPCSRRPKTIRIRKERSVFCFLT
ncbi:hypothetical protein FPOAC1_000371 [Fusarium poae]|uniref:hypothetical protein n=1 Tax=Fusarium poae TaxID=36050 RepID=UPI001CE7CB14|nr:hypothetical protein FPOAC1_000371 [Fusarium poae]KAG8674404.1 hypothetical protein FPOAC1_000371 [Fusarium poae]